MYPEMKLKLTENSKCICENGKLAVDCCLKGSWFFKEPCNILPSDSNTGFVNPKCYAGITQDCSDEITREHVISKGILEFIKRNGDLTAEGLPFQDEKTNLIGVNTLTIRRLCKRHNGSFSCLDSEMLRFIACIARYDSEFINGNYENRITLFSGHDIERWFLKTACNFVLSGNFAKSGVILDKNLPNGWLDGIFSQDNLPLGWGLYASPDKNINLDFSKRIGFRPLINQLNDQVVVIESWVNNFKFNFVLSKPNDQNHWGFFRPNRIVFKNQENSKIIEFSWKNTHENKDIIYDWTGN